MHVVTTGTNPTSLPPTVMVTIDVDRLSAPSWPASTLPVVAPLQATNANDDGDRSAAQSAGYPWGLRSQEPLAGS